VTSILWFMLGFRLALEKRCVSQFGLAAVYMCDSDSAELTKVVLV
jgi:hypothetical protein